MNCSVHKYNCLYYKAKKDKLNFFKKGKKEDNRTCELLNNAYIFVLAVCQFCSSFLFEKQI